jgi:CheY-like chemotaxis protein
MAGKRILVVDDQEMVLHSIKLTLASAGHSVETAGSGLEALRRLDADEFDLVLTDWKMIDMSGEKRVGEIKTRKPCVPIILISGLPPDKQPSGVDGVLLKPFSAKELREAVDEIG